MPALLVTACLASPRAAGAADAELRSRQLYKQGETLANDGNWVEACPLFQAAHDLHGTGGTALRTADCYEKVGKYDRALGMYQYIVDHKDTDKAERVALAEGRVAALKKQLGVDQPPAPPPPVVIVTKPAPAPSPPEPPKPPPPPPSKVPAFIAFGAGGVGLVVGAAFGGLALKEASDLKATCTAGVSCPQWGERRTAAETKAWVANTGFGVAVAGAVVGISLLFVRSAPAQAAVRSAVGPGGLVLRF